MGLVGLALILWVAFSAGVDNWLINGYPYKREDAFKFIIGVLFLWVLISIPLFICKILM